MSSFTRRKILLSSAGLLVPIPLLPSLHGCGKRAGDDALERGHPLVVVRIGSGVAQEDGDEPEMFWPTELGSLTKEKMLGDDRLTGELADFADRLLMVRGTRFAFGATREVHAGGGNQLLTGAQPGPPTETVMTYAMGESIDNWIARQTDVNGGEPLTLYAGRRDDYGEEVLSYRGPLELRGAESDPWRVYRRLIGADGAPEMRDSVNEVILGELSALMGNAQLSSEDRVKLELHTDAVRDFEVMSGRLSADIEAAMRDSVGLSADDAHSLDVARLHCDLIALVLDGGRARSVTLQVGDRLDNAQYTIWGQKLPKYHTLSHRLVVDDELGVFESSQQMHAEVNRLHLQVFHYLLERLDERGLLDKSVVVLTSDVATGSHRYDQVPWIIAGAGDGTLKQGAYVDAGDVTHNKLLNTLLTATGHRAEDGGPITDFGDESLEGGVVDEMLA